MAAECLIGGHAGGWTWCASRNRQKCGRDAMDDGKTCMDRRRRDSKALTDWRVLPTDRHQGVGEDWVMAFRFVDLIVCGGVWLEVKGERWRTARVRRESERGE